MVTYLTGRRGQLLSRAFSAVILGAVAACGSSNEPTTPVTSTGSLSFKSAPCSATSTVQLAVAQTARVDCSNGGSTVTLAGGGASYLIVAQLATYGINDTYIPYRLDSGASLSQALGALGSRTRASFMRSAHSLSALAGSSKLMGGRISRPRAKQISFTGALRQRARRNLLSGRWSAARTMANAAVSKSIRRSIAASPAVGSVRTFRVLGDSTGNVFKTVSASLAYAGNDVLLYIDTASPAGGFTAAQLQAFGVLFDQTLYPIDTANFGQPSDVDQNGHMIMLMSPAVNALTTASQCQTDGYVAGFFEEEDLAGGSSDPDSNNGEIFYSIVPDPNGTVSCAHSVADLGNDVPATFLHELQHLISFSQHVVVHGGNPEEGWLDEGLSIVAEELGSLYYEAKYPPPTGRTNPSQIFPDSSQGFVSDFLYDSYQYASLPDTASLTLHSDSDDGFSWRGGDWLLMRYLGDQFGPRIWKTFDQSTLTGVPNIEAGTGQTFPTTFANFGLALYVDSLPGLPRTTAPAVNRFVTRNVRQLWNRLYITSGGAPDVPLAEPVQLFPVTSDTTTAVMDPGTMSFFRLDTPSSSATISVQFAAPGGVALGSVVHPQLAIFRLPAGQ